MNEPNDPQSCKAYATLTNAGMDGCRFVGIVEMRTERGRVWLKSRRVRAWWVWARPWLRMLVLVPLEVVLSILCDSWQVGVDDSNGDVGGVWATYQTRHETVSWPAAKTGPPRITLKPRPGGYAADVGSSIRTMGKPAKSPPKEIA